MLQQDEPEDFVIATGMQHSVREFVTLAAEVIGIKLRWKGQGADEIGVDQSGSSVVAVDPLVFPSNRSGDSSRRSKLRACASRMDTYGHFRRTRQGDD